MNLCELLLSTLGSCIVSPRKSKVEVPAKPIILKPFIDDDETIHDF